MKNKNIFQNLCRGTYEGGDAYDCDVGSGKVPTWHFAKCATQKQEVVSSQFGNLPGTHAKW